MFPYVSPLPVSNFLPARCLLRSPPQFIADVDHDSIDYIKVTKNLYVPKEKLRIGKNGLNNEEVQEMRRKIDVKVR